MCTEDFLILVGQKTMRPMIQTVDALHLHIVVYVTGCGNSIGLSTHHSNGRNVARAKLDLYAKHE